MLQNDINLSRFLKKGGIYYNVPGTQPREVLAWLVNAVPSDSPEIPPAVFKEALLKAVLEREELMPTAMGNGIALPHPRNPLIQREDQQFAALAFPEQEINWQSLDGRPVNAVILVISASAKIHLALLQRITFFCQDEAFRTLLKHRAPAAEILDYVERTEAAWG
ncbi:MAG: PTS sugar transporter subunit IIA [Treponema sp.]|jgi:PTS system nitrogen regulatory IIA component|nr:PTS sugar transporter subunit IIA [Treponema sp.]